VKDLSVLRVKKETKRGKEHEYLHATWMVGGKTRNVYLGSCKKMSHQEVLEKTRRMKARRIGTEK
jgi:hypothetical protein